MRLAVALPVVFAVTTCSVLALAQAPEPPPPGATPAALPPAPAPAPAPAPLPSPAPAAAPVDNQTDHDRVVGRLGVGYMGQFDVPSIGVAGNTGISAPTQLVGARYWISQALAISAGVGVYASSGSSKTGTVTTDQPGLFAMSFKAGVPLAPFGSGKHFTFLIEPQAVFGFASQNSKGTGAIVTETSLNGTRLAVGATAGAEIQFGFMGIPELALTATVGMALDVKNGSRKQTTGATVEEQSWSELSFTTMNFNNPWNIFTGNVAAIYYF